MYGSCCKFSFFYFISKKLNPKKKVGDVSLYRLANPKVCEIQFSSLNRYQLSIHATSDTDERYLIVMKGAPEKIIKNCSTIFVDGCEVEFNLFWKKQYQKAFEELSKNEIFI